MIDSASNPGTCRLSNQSAILGVVPLEIAEQMAQSSVAMQNTARNTTATLTA